MIFVDHLKNFRFDGRLWCNDSKLGKLLPMVLILAPKFFILHHYWRLIHQTFLTHHEKWRLDIFWRFFCTAKLSLILKQPRILVGLTNTTILLQIPIVALGKRLTLLNVRKWSLSVSHPWLWLNHFIFKDRIFVSISFNALIFWFFLYIDYRRNSDSIKGRDCDAISVVLGLGCTDLLIAVGSIKLGWCDKQRRGEAMATPVRRCFFLGHWGRHLCSSGFAWVVSRSAAIIKLRGQVLTFY